MFLQEINKKLDLNGWGDGSSFGSKVKQMKVLYQEDYFTYN